MKYKHLFFLAIGLLSIIGCTKKADEVLPTLSNIEVEAILRNTIKCSSYIEKEGSSEVTECGFCWSLSPDPTVENNFIIDPTTPTISVTIPDLQEETTYYLRAYAKSNVGITYSEQTITTTLNKLETGQLIDVDGNKYNTVLINNTWWMAENLKVTHYSNGGEIPKMEDKEPWMNPTKGYRCYYGNDSITTANTYGALYNYYVVSDARKVCPTGWHVPTIEEWRSLIDYCGGTDDAPLKLIDPNSNWRWNTGLETNETGFSALGGGGRDAGANYYKLTIFGEWWSSSAMNLFDFSSVNLTNDGFYEDSHYFSFGKSIRCIKNED